MNVSRLLLIGSASVHTWRYLAGIAPYVNEVYLASNGEVPERYRPSNLTAVLQVDFRFLSILTAPRLRAWVTSICPDIVHVHQANSIAWHARRALSGSKVPLVLTAWGSDILRLPKRSALMRYLVVANLKAAVAVTSDSLYLAAVVRELLGESASIDVLNFGIDTLPPLVNLVKKHKRIISCRLHKPLYRIDSILRAWSEIEQHGRFSDWSLTIAANGEDSENLLVLAAQLQLTRVEFTGFIAPETLADLYQQSRVFISIPQSDATSISLLEAMAHGCLPVLSNLPSNGEWVISGLNGVIVENVRYLSRTLMMAMAEAEDDCRLAAIAHINRQLVTDKALHHVNMQSFANLYSRVLAMTL